MSIISVDPLVSIVVPAYNHENYVQDTIESLISQEYPNLELIILNDGSTDDTAQRIKNMIQQCSDRFCRVEYIEKNNEGLSKTLNQGIRLAKGQYIFPLASDDVANSDAISSLVQLAQQDNSIAVVCGDANFIDSQGNRHSLRKNGVLFDTVISFNTLEKKDFSIEQNFGSYQSFLTGNYISGGFLVRRSVYGDVGYFAEDIMLEDWDFWLRVSKKNRIVFLGKVTAGYRIHESNTYKLHQKRLVMDAIKILKREYAYCAKNGYGSEWQKAMAAYLTEISRININEQTVGYKFDLITTLINERVFYFKSGLIAEWGYLVYDELQRMISHRKYVETLRSIRVLGAYEFFVILKIMLTTSIKKVLLKRKITKG